MDGATAVVAQEAVVGELDGSWLDLSYDTDLTSEGCLADGSASADTEEDANTEREQSQSTSPLFPQHPPPPPHASTARGLARHVSHRRDRADLLCAKGRILQLETVVESQQRAMKRARVLEEGKEEGKKFGTREMAKLHRLEQDRRSLSEQLASTKEKLLSLESALKENMAELDNLERTHRTERMKLSDQLSETQSSLGSLKSENGYLKSRIQHLEDQMRTKCTAFEEMEENYQQIIGSLKTRVLKVEEEEMEVMRLSKRVRELEQVVRDEEERRRVVNVLHQQLMEYEKLKQQNAELAEENSVLRQNTDNVKLLTYQLQTLRQRCDKLGSLESELERSKLENQELMERLRKIAGTGVEGSAGSPTLLHHKVTQLMQKEIVMLTAMNDLKTEVKVLEKALSAQQAREGELERMLAKEQATIKTNTETIQRLERRLQFLSKERDGYVSVLNSYKLDQGVNSVLKELVTELEQDKSRSAGHIAQLESVLKDSGAALATERQRAVQAEDELRELRSLLDRTTEKTASLESEKQRLEALVLALLGQSPQIKSDTTTSD